MIYFLVTTSLYNDCTIRKNQYINGINSLKNAIQKNNIEDYKIIIIENNGNRETFLNDICDNVFYTYNNFLRTNNKGIKELYDILDCINFYNINGNDFIVKFTGRYIIDENSEFINALQYNNLDCIIRYGSYQKPSDIKMEDCITGLIGMRCKYIKNIKTPAENECVEWKWAKITKNIDDYKTYIPNKLGLQMCPGGNIYSYYV